MATHAIQNATLAEIISYAQQHKKQHLPNFICKVEIKGIRNPTEWFTMTCGGTNCMKGLTSHDDDLWCEGCDNPVMFPRPRFRLLLEVCDHTANAVIVCMDDTARVLTKTTAQSIINAESGLCNNYSLYQTTDDAPYTPNIITGPHGTLTTIPQCIYSLFGTTQTMQLATSSYYNHGHFETVNCTKVLQPLTAMDN